MVWALVQLSIIPTRCLSVITDSYLHYGLDIELGTAHVIAFLKGPCRAHILICLGSFVHWWKYTFWWKQSFMIHYSDVTMGRWRLKSPASQLFTQPYISADQRKHQSSSSLAFVRGIHRWPVNSPHKLPVTRKMFPFDDVIMCYLIVIHQRHGLIYQSLKLYTSNSLWPSGDIWRHRLRSTLAQVMACCLKAPSHFLGQCGVIIHEVLW